MRDDVSKLEPSLDGRFREALFFPDEGQVEPRRVLPELHARIRAAGGMIEFGTAPETSRHCGSADRLPRPRRTRHVSGPAGRQGRGDYRRDRRDRAVAPGATPSSPMAALIIPREHHQFRGRPLDRMRGRRRQRTFRAGTAQRRLRGASGVRRGADRGDRRRPAARLFPTTSRVAIDKNRIAVDGLYRHGFLLAPALAELTLGLCGRGRWTTRSVMQCK